MLDLVPRRSLEALMEAMESGTELTPASIKKITGLSDQNLESLLFFLEGGKDSYADLLLALETASAVLKHSEREKETIDLSWTGPIQFSVEGRSTQSLIEEMLRNAKKSIVIIGYSITEEGGVLELISAAMKRGVEVVLVVHSDEESRNIEVISKNWLRNPKPLVYTRERGKTDVYFKIHAKMMVVDSSDLLVTSANLTWHGMSNNLEIGLRVRGKTAEKAYLLVDELIKSGYLTKKTW